MYEYVKLLDEMDHGTIVKANGGDQYRYVFGLNDWIRSGILFEYHIEHSYKYEEYVDISEEEAYASIERQRMDYERLMESVQRKAAKVRGNYRYLYDAVCKEHYFKETETSITALAYYMRLNNRIYSERIEIQEESIVRRINESVKILFKNTDLTNEEELINLRVDRNAGDIKILELKEMLKTERNKEKEEIYKIALAFIEHKIIYLNQGKGK